MLRHHITRMFCAAGLVVCLFPTLAFPQSTSDVPSLVEVYWQSSRTIVVPGVTQAIILDEDIASTETETDSIRIFGLARGETVMLAYRKGEPVSIRINVVERPDVPVPPSLSHSAEMAQGSYSSTAQISHSNGTTGTSFLNGFSWAQPMGKDGHLDFTSQIEDDSTAGQYAFNVRRASLFYNNPGMDVHALDFTQDMTGGQVGRQYLGPYSFMDVTELRGASVTLRRGQNEYDFYGGTTVPYFFLTLGSTRDVLGFSFNRKQTDKLSLFASTSLIDAPADYFSVDSPRQKSVMQIAGATYQFNPHWAMRATGGVSTHGGLARDEVVYSGNRLSAYGAASSSSPLFPLNQLESLFAGTKTLRAGGTFRNEDWLTESLTYQHIVTDSIGGILLPGSSDFVSPGAWIKFRRDQDVNVNYTYSRNSGGFSTSSSTGNRLDANWHYQISNQISNAAEVTVGSIQDPLQLNSEDEFSWRDSLSFPVRLGSMFVSFQQDRTNPSLVQKLNSELGLLSPALQTLFLQDPVSFINSSNLPPDVRAILEAQQPVSTAVSASGQFALGGKLSVSPNFSFARIDTGSSQSWSPFFGYGLSYQIKPTLQFNSGLTNIWVLANNATSQRTMLFSFGFNKFFSAAPASLMPGHHERMIEGRVFRDNNIDGRFNAWESGLGGIQVQLENGQSVMTDHDGRYKFNGVSAGQHTVSVALAQFRGPVRMTTQNAVDVDMIQHRSVVVNFGVVDFSRVMGNVFNDLRADGKRQPDSTGMQGIHLILDDGKEQRSVTTEGSGDYEAEDVPPGDYKLIVDTDSIPANYTVPTVTFSLHVSPVATVVADVPVQALRSISGRVVLKMATNPVSSNAIASRNKGSRESSEVKLVPLANIQLSAGTAITRTDSDGNFLLRNLPAGDLKVSVVPIKSLPDGLQAPSGPVHMPDGPVQVQGAIIVISNPQLLGYLTEELAQKFNAPDVPGR